MSKGASQCACDGGDAWPKTTDKCRGNVVNAKGVNAKRPTLLAENRASAIHLKHAAEGLRGSNAQHPSSGIIRIPCWRRSSGTCSTRRCGP